MRGRWARGFNREPRHRIRLARGGPSSGGSAAGSAELTVAIRSSLDAQLDMYETSSSLLCHLGRRSIYAPTGGLQQTLCMGAAPGIKVPDRSLTIGLGHGSHVYR
jgi:hypothetical protein